MTNPRRENLNFLQKNEIVSLVKNKCVHVSLSILSRVSYVPKRATISLVVKPLLVKTVKMSLRSIAGDGMLATLFASSRLAVVGSLLPN